MSLRSIVWQSCRWRSGAWRQRSRPSGAYIIHGALRDTTNQFAHPTPGSRVAMVLLIIGEIGGFGVLLAGFVVAQFF
jgi:hypothetical protein